MNLYDIIGPIMIGPSSSHTAGAVRLGNVARAVLGQPPTVAKIGLHGSFAKTGKGHGTDLALIAGLMGWATDDVRIPRSFEYAPQSGLSYEFHTIDMGENAHPNLVHFALTGADGPSCTLVGTSIGGGRVRVNEIDGFPLEFGGEFPTLLTMHEDRPGAIALVTGILSQESVNIAQMRVFRRDKGGLACMVMETDQPVSDKVLSAVAALPMLHSIRRIDPIR